MKTIKKFFVIVSLLAITLPSMAFAYFCMEGTWIVQCPNGHRDRVDDITCNHDCETCGAKTVDNGTAYVVCPDGHATKVTGVTTTHLCTYQFADGRMCGKQCRQ